MTDPFTKSGDAGFALIEAHRAGQVRLNDKSGSFCGQLVAGMDYLSEKQSAWLAKLLERAGLPGFDPNGGAS